jgi:methyltransferase family protein
MHVRDSGPSDPECGASSLGSEGFFDRYSRFYSTSRTWAVPNRLNRRYDALVGRNAQILDGASVVDLGSHDGRWTLAALEAGAKRVVGIEARPDLVAQAEATLAAYGLSRASYEFVCGDAHVLLGDLDPDSVDVVLCFGFFHETIRHAELLHAIRRLRPSHLVMDVWIHPRTDDPVIRLYLEDSGIESSSFPFHSATGDPLVGHPSRAALELLLADAGFGDLDYFDWLAADIDDWNDLEDYRDRRRVSLVARNLETG